MARKRLVTRTPTIWLGALAEALAGTCGRSVIIDGAWYRFKRGQGLVMSRAQTAKTRPDLCIVDAGQSDEAEALRRLIRTKRSPLTNCATVFAPFWRSDMSGVSPGDRSSIVRAVLLGLLGLLVTVALIVSAVVGIGFWIDAKLDAMQRSNAAHFGQIKSMIEELSEGLL